MASLKGRHSGEPRIGSGAGTGVQIIYSHLSKNDWMRIRSLDKKVGWVKASGIEVTY